MPLLAKGLNDREASLRGAAALGLGLTKLAVAVGPLLNRLPQETDAEVEMEIVRALGRVGDPRAVPVLAERAAGGGFFSRIPTAIRVEAVRALGELGGEPARAVLQRLLRDRSPEVREAVLKALSTPDARRRAAAAFFWRRLAPRSRTGRGVRASRGKSATEAV